MSEQDGLERLTFQVKDVMVRDPITIDVEMSVKQAAILMDRSGCGCLLATSHGKVVGILTERDLVTRVLTKTGRISRMRVKSVVSSPLVVVSPEATAEEAAKIMAQNKVHRLPVLGKHGLLGIITVSDIAKALAEQSNYCNMVFNALARSPKPPENIYR